MHPFSESSYIYSSSSRPSAKNTVHETSSRFSNMRGGQPSQFEQYFNDSRFHSGISRNKFTKEVNDLFQNEFANLDSFYDKINSDKFKIRSDFGKNKLLDQASDEFFNSKFEDDLRSSATTRTFKTSPPHPHQFTNLSSTTTAPEEPLQRVRRTNYFEEHRTGSENTKRPKVEYVRLNEEDYDTPKVKEKTSFTFKQDLAGEELGGSHFHLGKYYDKRNNDSNKASREERDFYKIDGGKQSEGNHFESSKEIHNFSSSQSSQNKSDSSRHQVIEENQKFSVEENTIQQNQERVDFQNEFDRTPLPIHEKNFEDLIREKMEIFEQSKQTSMTASATKKPFLTKGSGRSKSPVNLNSKQSDSKGFTQASNTRSLEKTNKISENFGANFEEDTQPTKDEISVSQAHLSFRDTQKLEGSLREFRELEKAIAKGNDFDLNSSAFNRAKRSTIDEHSVLSESTEFKALPVEKAIGSFSNLGSYIHSTFSCRQTLDVEKDLEQKIETPVEEPKLSKLDESRVVCSKVNEQEKCVTDTSSEIAVLKEEIKLLKQNHEKELEALRAENSELKNQNQLLQNHIAILEKHQPEEKKVHVKTQFKEEQGSNYQSSREDPEQVSKVIRSFKNEFPKPLSFEFPNLDFKKFHYSTNEYYQAYFNKTVEKISSEAHESGAERQNFSNGFSIILFKNGHSKQILPNGSIIYHFPEQKLTLTKSPDSPLQVYYFEDEQIEFVIADTRKVVYTDGVEKKIIGSEEFVLYPDGTVEGINSKGDHAVLWGKGGIEVRMSDGTIFTESDTSKK